MKRRSINPSSASKQRGIALMMALAVVSIASVIGVELWFENQLSLARASNIQQSTQSRHYARGMVLWAKDLLFEEEQQNPGVDTLNDAWHQTIEGVVVKDAIISGRLQDMTNCFNVNNLWLQGKPQLQQRAYLERLFSLVELDNGLIDKMVDWMDSDQVPNNAGAEDFVYLSKRVPYQTASTHFRHISQLQLLDGLSANDFKRLSQFVCVLPVNKANPQNPTAVPTRMNINMLPAVMIKALHPSITTQTAVSIRQDGQAAFRSLDDFFDFPVLKRIGLRATASYLPELIGVESTFLQAEIRINMNNIIYPSFVMLSKKAGGFIQVIQWSSISFLNAPNS